MYMYIKTEPLTFFYFLLFKLFSGSSQKKSNNFPIKKILVKRFYQENSEETFSAKKYE